MSLPRGSRPSPWELVRLAPEAAWQRVTYRGRGVLRPDGDVDEAGVPRRSIVVASSQRTGSTLVVDSLRRTGVAGVPHEYFSDPVIGEAFESLGFPELPLRARLRRQARRARLRHDWAATSDVAPGSLGPYLDHLLRCRTTPNGVFATKLHWPQYQSITRAGVAVTDFPQPVSWVYVSRRDRVAQAVSLARARQSGEWSATPAQRRRPYAPFYDEAAISRALVDVDAWSRGWDDYFRETGIVPIRVVYEDLAARYAGEIQRLFDELGLGVVADPDPPTRRQADAISAEWIARFRAATSTP